MVLTNLPHDPLLDLDPWVGQRSASYRFAVVNGVTGIHQGDITPLRSAQLNHNTAQSIKRQLTMSLGVSDFAAINTIQDRIWVYMVFPSGVEYPLGKYMFTDASAQQFTSGDLGNLVLNDEMFLVDQGIEKGIDGFAKPVSLVVQETLSGLPINYTLEGSAFRSSESWGVGTARGSILEALAVSGDYFSPWFDNSGIMRFIRTFNPADKIPDLDLDAGNQVMRADILKTNDLLNAPNVFLVISNNSSDLNAASVGIARVPANAPHSVQNRGFAITETQNLQLSDSIQAQAVAQGLANRQTIFERVSLSTAPDPRYDSYTVVHWQGQLWLDLAWSLTLVEGSPMTHTLRRAYHGN